MYFKETEDFDTTLTKWEKMAENLSQAESSFWRWSDFRVL